MAGRGWDREHWQAIEAVLDEVLELPPDERTARLDHLCAGRPRLRAEVEDLLMAASASEGFLEAPAPQQSEALLDRFFPGPEEPALAEGAELGPYRVVREVGRGGVGTVYEAHDSRLDRRVALKVLSRGADRDEAARTRFLREARSASALDHPNLGTVFDVGETEDGRLYIVMAFYDGESLKRLLERGPLAIESACALALQIAAGLERAHEAGIVHRDVKPANVVLTERGEIKILDFGLAKMIGAVDLTRTGISPGTPAYMSPEQVRGEEADRRSDLWSLGVVLYEMLTGSRPFGGDSPLEVTDRILRHAPEPVGAFDRSVPAAVSRIVERLLAKDPQERYPDASDLQADLQAGLAAARHEAPVTRPRRLVAAGLGLLLALVAGAAAMLWHDPLPAPPLYVVVAEPERLGGAPAGDLALATRGVSTAIVQGLLALEGVAPLRAGSAERGEDEIFSAASALAADEIVTSRLSCRPLRCRIELSRRAGDDGRLLASRSFDVPTDDYHLLVSAVANQTRAAYGSHPRRRGATSTRFESAQWGEYLRLRTIFESKDGASEEELLGRLATLRRDAPAFLEVYLLEAEVLRQRFHFSRDESALERGFELLASAHELDQEDLRPLFLTFDLAGQAGRWDRAREALEPLTELDPAGSRVLLRRARLAEHEGDTEGALGLKRRAVEAQSSAENLLSLAFTEYRSGDIPAAVETLSSLLERSPRDFRAMSFLAQLRLASGELEQAAELFERLTARAPDVTELANLGLVYSLLGRAEEALGCYRRAYDLEPSNASAALNLADGLETVGRSAEAARAYERVVTLLDAERGPGGWQQRTVRAQALAHLGRGEEAVAEVQRALQSEPRNPQAAFEAAVVYAVIGQSSSALVNLERSLELGLGAHWLDLAQFDGLRGDPAFRALASAAAREGGASSDRHRRSGAD